MVTTYVQLNNGHPQIKCDTLSNHDVVVVAIYDLGKSQTDLFFTWEQLRALHIAIGVAMLDHPEKYETTVEEASND